MILELVSTKTARDEKLLTSLASDSSLTASVARAEQGDPEAYYQLGLAFSSGRNEVARDLIEAHKWFNLAAAQGHAEAKACRADIADELTAREIHEAQSRARLWLVVNGRIAA